MKARSFTETEKSVAYCMWTVLAYIWKGMYCSNINIMQPFTWKWVLNKPYQQIYAHLGVLVHFCFGIFARKFNFSLLEPNMNKDIDWKLKGALAFGSGHVV